MLICDQELVCTIDRLGYMGEGVFRRDGQVGFVHFALPGETVRVVIEKVHKTHVFARLKEIIKPSSDRVMSPCQVFTRCGGCTLQHLAYQEQLRAKQQVVQDNLKKIARVNLQVLQPIGLSQPWAYRNKTTWQAGRGPGGLPVLGFYEMKSHAVVPVDQCLIAVPEANRAADCITQWMRRCSVMPYNPTNRLGLIRQVVTRVSPSGEVMVLLAVNGEALPCAHELADMLSSVLPGFHGLAMTSEQISEDDEDGLPWQILSGNALLTIQLAGIHLRLSPMSFSQVNYRVCENMYAYVLRQAIRDSKDTIFDLYSGIGALSLAAAQICRQVIGVELSSHSVEDARKNADINHICNARFIQGLAENKVPLLVQAGKQPDAIILDPPRKGAHLRVLQAILQAKPSRIVYISCHPASQARDTAVLIQGGYRTIEAQPFDMFCQTAQIENVMTFVRNDTE